MKTIYKYLILVLFLLINFNLLAQDFDLIKIQSSFYPKQSIEESTVDGEIGFFEWSGQLAFPQRFKKSKNTILIHTLGYTNLRMDAEATVDFQSLESNKHYHTISYNLGFVRIFNPRWRMILNLNPIIASDFGESLDGDDLLMQGNGMALYAKNKNTTYGFGVVYTNRFGRPAVVPMGIFKYKTAKMNVDIILPNKLSLMFNTPSRKFHYGFLARLNGGLFNNTNDLNIINAIVDEAGYSRLNIGPAIAVKLNNNVKVNLAGGMAVARRMEFVDINENTFDRTPENGPFFNVGLTFVPKKKAAVKPPNQK